MIAEGMKKLVAGSSIIRAMFEEGKKMAAQVGAENVYDFSLGNPSVEPPVAVKEAIKQVLDEDKPNYVHGYMSNAGYEDVRDAVAESINRKHGTAFSRENIVMTVGAAGGLNVIFRVLLNPDDEVVTFAPFFGEYKNYVANVNAKLVPVPAKSEDFQPDIEGLRDAINEKTKIVLVNTPNNPTGVVYSEGTIMSIAKVMEDKEKEYGHAIFLVSDEPYRELAYDGVFVPYLTKYYKNTVIGYSFSKSLSLPGERIGYLVIPSESEDFEDMISAAGVATRILGFVNAPSLMQRAVAKCLEETTDIEIYNANRELLYNALTEYGFECVKPQGAFYLWMKSPEADDKAFSAKAKELHLLIVPGSGFGGPGYVRIAYCVDKAMIERSLPAFKKLAEMYGL